MFRSALEIPEPWYVFHHESDKEEKTLHIYIEYRKGAEFSCSNCGSPGCKVHDIQDQDGRAEKIIEAVGKTFVVVDIYDFKDF